MSDITGLKGVQKLKTAEVAIYLYKLDSRHHVLGSRPL